MKDLNKIIKCPVCGKLTSLKGNPYRPFCSKQCKMKDLAAWFREEYRISDSTKIEDELVNTSDQVQYH
jgi:endogenous inhibitor of DNA gyrase (YacG/DUF329 family)